MFRILPEIAASMAKYKIVLSQDVIEETRILQPQEEVRVEVG